MLDFFFSSFLSLPQSVSNVSNIKDQFGVKTDKIDILSRGLVPHMFSDESNKQEAYTYVRTK